MALPPTSPFRGVAAAIDQPASEGDVEKQLSPLLNGLQLNDHVLRFRNAVDDQDITEAVYRWDTRSFREIFRTGFSPWPQRSDQSDVEYYDYSSFVMDGGRPADTSRASPSVFVSATRSVNWRPRLSTDCTIYRYQIYAPGGIDAVLTMGQYTYANQQEISFAGGIRPQYIRMARIYRVTMDGQFPVYSAEGNRLYRNGLFDPNPSASGWTSQEFLNGLRNPTCPRQGEYLINIIGAPRRAERDVGNDEEHFQDPICRVPHYIQCAFNFSDREEAYLFIEDQYLRIEYAPGSTDDRIIEGPQTIGEGFSCLKDTIFATGIDAAFTASRKNEAYIFRSNIYALINFEPDDCKIIQGPKLITDSFYSLKDTIFENGIEAAFTSSRQNEAYIFRGDKYALIDFAPGTTEDKIIQGPKKITESFDSLKDTIFKNGLDAAFSSSRENEAYIFKGNTYALINFAPGSTEDYIIQGPKNITESFHSLEGVIPMYNCGC